MKILFIVSWYSSFNSPQIREGIFHYEMVCALKKKCDVAIYFPFDNSIKGGFSDSIEHGIRVFRRNNTKASKIKRYLNYLSDYKTIKKQFKFDLIHVHVAQGAGKVAYTWKRIFNEPYIVTEHTPLEMMNFNSKKNKYISRLIYSNSLKNICVSDDLSSKLQTVFPKLNFSVIYNGVFLPTENSSENFFPIKKTHKFNCAIIAVFYDKDIKGFQFLLPAIKNLIDLNIDICLHICGGGTYLELYKTVAAELGISSNCIFYGQLEKNSIYSIISQMDFIVSASLFESAGVSVEESMILGKPLVITRSGGASSLVTEKTAIVVDTKSVSALVQGITQMILHLENFDSVEIKKYALENFEMEHVMQKYMDLYESFLIR